MWELIPALSVVQSVAVIVSAVLTSIWVVVKIWRARRHDGEWGRTDRWAPPSSVRYVHLSARSLESGTLQPG